MVRVPLTRDGQSWNAATPATTTARDPPTRMFRRETSVEIRPMLRDIVLIGALLFSSIGAAAATTVEGTFAFQGGRRVTEGHLRYEPTGSDPLDQHIVIWMNAHGASQPITSYAVEMTKPLHVIIVDSSLSTFAHIHPTLGPDGFFRIDQHFPAPGTYYLYADGLPNGADHQVFRFPLRIGNQPAVAPVALVPTGRELSAGPYTVDLSKARLTAGTVDTLEVGVYEGDAPARNLHPYLGAAAHAVFLNSRDLTYVHVHPMAQGSDTTGMDMKGMDMSTTRSMDLPDSASVPARIVLHVAVNEPGLYKMWLQFRGGSRLYVVPFVLRAE
jgi:hypothetical protein